MTIISYHAWFTAFVITSTVEETTFDSDETTFEAEHTSFEAEQTCCEAEQASCVLHDVIDESGVIAEWFATRSAPSRTRSAPSRKRHRAR